MTVVSFVAARSPKAHPNSSEFRRPNSKSYIAKYLKISDFDRYVDIRLGHSGSPVFTLDFRPFFSVGYGFGC